MTNQIKLISYITAGLVALLALLAFVLSYSSLQNLAAQHGTGFYLSYLWPLLLDFAMIVFSLAILRANLRQEPARYPWSLAIVFAGLATAGNVLDVEAMAVLLGIPAIWISAAVKALAPVALVLAFELLMSMVKAEIKRAAVVESLAALTADCERLTVESERLTGRRDSLKEELAALKAEKRTVAYTAIGDDTRAAATEILSTRVEISGAELGRMLGKSATTGRRLKKELLAEINHNGNGAGHAGQ